MGAGGGGAVLAVSRHVLHELDRAAASPGHGVASLFAGLEHILFFYTWLLALGLGIADCAHRQYGVQWPPFRALQA